MFANPALMALAPLMDRPHPSPYTPIVPNWYNHMGFLPNPFAPPSHPPPSMVYMPYYPQSRRQRRRSWLLRFPLDVAVKAMKELVLNDMQLHRNGFPVECNGSPDMAVVYIFGGWAHGPIEGSTGYQCIHCKVCIVNENEECTWTDKFGHKKSYHKHLHENLKIGSNTVNGFINTKYNNSDQGLSIISIDCEMCLSSEGIEVTRVSLVDMRGNCVYNAFVKPQGEIIDLCTEFSGVRQSDLENALSFDAVRTDLSKFITWKTILIGHALSNDLRVLKIIHRNVIDTSLIYPHRMGWPYKISLKALSKAFLGYEIQNDHNGHCSIKDAQSAMKLTVRAWTWVCIQICGELRIPYQHI